MVKPSAAHITAKQAQNTESLITEKTTTIADLQADIDLCDALKIVSEGVNAVRSPERAMLVITHYQRLLDYIKPDRVHVLAGGRIVASGGPELALELEKNGYDQYGKVPA